MRHTTIEGLVSPLWVCLGIWACQPLTDLDAAASGDNSAGLAGQTTQTEADSSGPAVGVSPEVAPQRPISTTAPSPSTVSTTSATPTTAPSVVSTSAAPPSDDESTTAASTELQSVPTESATSATVTESSSAPEESDPATDTSDSSPSACTSKCALGTACSNLQHCASLRCDELCQPMQFGVISNGLEAISTSIKVHVELTGDPLVAVAWRDLAVLYFFTVETHGDFKLNFAQGGGTAMPMRLGLSDWVLVWTTDAPGNVPGVVTPFDVQLHSYPWLPDTPESNNNANDYSYRSGTGPNDKIVLCQRIDGEWRHIQGTPPSNLTAPACSYVNNCEAALMCDPLEPSPGP